MPQFSYPRPKNPIPWKSVQPRPLLPFSTPPQPLLVPPELPSPPRQLPSTSPYVLSTHIIPAAYPRLSPDLPLPPDPPAGSSKAEKKEFAIRNCNVLLELEDRYVNGEFGLGSRKVLWNCVNRYVKKNRDRKGHVGGLTLFFAHANGFPKEIWEPTLEHLLSAPSESLIDEIWCWESVQHGDSGLLNSESLSGVFDWSDNTRDILNFLLDYLPSSVTSAVLPTHLPRLPSLESKRRRGEGYQERTLIAIGHSYGGCTLSLAAINCPALFWSLILVDPVIIRPLTYRETREMTDFVLGALQRRNTWPSRAEAFQLFSQLPFFAAWDPAVLKIYVECGLTDNADGSVGLKMSGVHEAILFAGRRTPYEVWELLDQLDERVELRWITPEKTGAPRIGGSEQTRERVWRRAKNTSNIIIPNAGHLIAQESPRELAQDIDLYLCRKVETIRANL